MNPFLLLIADDHLDMIKLLEYALGTMYGQQVQAVAVLTVDELRKQLAPDQPVPDLLLLDFHLNPEPFTAPDILEWISQQPHLDTLRVEIWSAGATASQQQTCLDLGAQRFHSKTKAFSDIVGFVRQLVGSSQK
jgi:CheY-like chemotaxis protein